jgi:hypothetical protein
LKNFTPLHSVLNPHLSLFLPSLMESTVPYGFIPTHWIQISLAISYVFTLASAIPTLFFQYRNFTLGILIVIALLFQLAGHTSMAVSAFLPENLPTWAVHYTTFALGKCAARVVVFYAYYTCFRRLGHSSQDSFRYSIVPAMVTCGLSFLFRFLIIGFDVAFHLKGLPMDSQPFVEPSVLILISSLGLIAGLIHVILETRMETPWYRLTWMTGYYTTLQIIPIFILTQDIYDVVKPFFSYRNEMVELLCDMGMTKSILILLGGQSYEIASAWCQERPNAIVMIEARIKELIYRRRENGSQILP